MCNSEGTLPATATEMENELRQDTFFALNRYYLRKGIYNMIYVCSWSVEIHAASITSILIHMHFIFLKDLCVYSTEISGSYKRWDRQHIITQLAAKKTLQKTRHILSSRGSYNPYLLLPEPEESYDVSKTKPRPRRITAASRMAPHWPVRRSLQEILRCKFGTGVPKLPSRELTYPYICIYIYIPTWEMKNYLKKCLI